MICISCAVSPTRPGNGDVIDGEPGEVCGVVSHVLEAQEHLFANVGAEIDTLIHPTRLPAPAAVARVAWTVGLAERALLPWCAAPPWTAS